jgi:hypothetical protein
MLYFTIILVINDVNSASAEVMIGFYKTVYPQITLFYQTTAAPLDYAIGCAYPGFKDFYSEGGWEITFFI